MAPTDDAFARLWPEARTTNLLEDSLVGDLTAAGGMTPAMVERFIALARYMAATGADAILFTCSAFGAAIDAAKQAVAIPVLRPNEAMIDDALDAGSRICLMMTFAPAIASMRVEFEAAAAARGTRMSFVGCPVPGAMAALTAGRAEEHDTLIARAAAEATDCDALALGQFSMARAAAGIAPLAGRRVLTTPDSAVKRLRRLLGA